MELNTACRKILSQLRILLNQISEDDFQKPVNTLGGSTIGQHLRHTLEFFICLQQGVNTGIVNYDKRNHDKLIETDKSVALAVLDRIACFTDYQSEDIRLRLEVDYDTGKKQFVSVDTNYSRELIYNIEHAVHHMAIIRIGVNVVAAYVELPNDFGIAASTVRYLETLTSSS